MFTNRAKALAGIVIGVAVVGSLSYVQYGQEKQIRSLQQPLPITVTKIVEVTPTEAPTATPAASLKTRIGTPVVVTRGVLK